MTIPFDCKQKKMKLYFDIMYKQSSKELQQLGLSGVYVWI
jgi:hypothetical protein